MKTRKLLSLSRVLKVFVAGLFLFVLTACGSGSKVLANDNPTTRSNKPVDVMQPSDTQQRENVSGAKKRAEELVNQSKRNLDQHGNYQGNYQGSNNVFAPKKSIPEIAGDVKDKAGEGFRDFKDNLQNTADDAKSATKAAARNAKTAADDVSRKAKEVGDDVRSRTFGDD